MAASTPMLVSVTITDSRETEIADAISSVVEQVDRVLVLDTGVTDKTLEIARDIAGDKLAVERHAWVDFSMARNAALRAAEELGATWILIVDSDERIDAPDLRSALAQTKADVVLFESADGHYPKEKIVRAGKGARFVGPTHEALCAEGPRETIKGAVFYERGKTAEQLQLKFARDVELLTAYLETHPDDPRWWYYLGASYEGLDERELAAEAFGTCFVKRGRGDEAAWAAYKQAEQLFILERHDEAVVAGARGLVANATFAECAWICAVASARKERFDQATAWARIAEAVGLHKGCGGERSWFRHLPALYELPYDVLRYSLSATEEREKANDDFRAAKLARLGATCESDLDELSISRSTPTHARHEARSILNAPCLSDHCSSFSPVHIAFEPPAPYSALNPNLCWYDGALWCVIRTVNYSLSGRQYTVHGDDGIIRTVNYLGALDPRTGALKHLRRMHDLDTSARRYPSWILGYEDVRLVATRDGLEGSATVCDRDLKSRRLIARLKFDGDGNVQCATVQKTNQEHEKNWMPLAIEGELKWIYSLDPTAILPGPLNACPFALDHLRGGAAIPFDDGYLCVVHETVEADASRVYMHRFVRLDAGFRVTAVSPVWVFAHRGIEFCSGLVRDDDDLLLGYGLDDREAWVARIAIQEIKEMEWITPN